MLMQRCHRGFHTRSLIIKLISRPTSRAHEFKKNVPGGQDATSRAPSILVLVGIHRHCRGFRTQSNYKKSLVEIKEMYLGARDVASRASFVLVLGIGLVLTDFLLLLRFLHM